MKVITRVFVLIGLFVLATGLAMAKGNDYAKIRELISHKFGKHVAKISQSPIPGLYQVTVPPMVFYMTKDGHYVINGDIIDLVHQVNISARARDAAKEAALAKVSKKDMIIYAPKKVKHVVTVFTDLDCAYCRKLHSEIPEYNKLGIEIRYMAFPRAGIGSSSYDKAVAAWCSKDRKKAFHEAFEGFPIPRKTCKNPVAKEFKLGEELGIQGTPSIVLADGRVVPGYAPPNELNMVLNQIDQQAKN